MPTFRELLSDHRVHVFDGAMGTVLYGRGVFVNVCYDELSLRSPDLVRDIHRDYVKAGAEVLETNTFGANPVKLGHYGLAAETEAINAAAARLAREAAGNRSAVLGAIGPLGVRIEPYGEMAVGEAEAAFARQVAGLLEGGVDGLARPRWGGGRSAGLVGSSFGRGAPFSPPPPTGRPITAPTRRRSGLGSRRWGWTSSASIAP
jgi:methionine synthase I (cobalamin-dependent)